MITIVGLTILALITEISTIVIYGPVRTKITIDLVDYTLNDFDKHVINDYGSPFKTPYIATVPLPILFKYYVEDVGVIPRWCKAHKQIEKKFKELKNEAY